MIQSILFDLDGTLVQTEILKAESYALAAGMVCLAVPSSFTRSGVEQSGLLPESHIASSPKRLQQTAERLLQA